jgi:hypothetical protein
MSLRRTVIIVAAIALTTVATVVFGQTQGSAVRAEAAAMPLSHQVSPPLGPIPCPDGSTVDFGQFCPLPAIQCADGSTVPFGQFCPLRPVTTATTNAPQSPPPQQVTCPDGSVVQEVQGCPTPKASPPWVVTVQPPTSGQTPATVVTVNPPSPGQSPPVSTVYLCGAGYHYEGGQCVGNGPIVR